MKDQLILIPVHCNEQMHSHGRYKGGKRYRCSKCGRVTSERGTRSREVGDRSVVSGRNIIYLGAGHPWANSDGWQYVYRYVVCEALGRSLLSCEHVDHIDKNKMNDDIRNLRLMLAKDHGYRHTGGSYTVIAEWKDGKFVEIDRGCSVPDVPF